MNSMLTDLQSAEMKTETAFVSLSDIFPQLMTVRQNKRPDDIPEKIAFLRKECDSFGSVSGDFWKGREEVYGPMLEKLNEKIRMLDDLERDVQVIRECSEEMELLSLNAMVISIKSGAKGRAFSSITESLKRLSSSMIENSSRLVKEQNSLLEAIRSLEGILSDLSASQKTSLSSCETGHCTMQSVLDSVGNPLPEIDRTADSVWEYISKSMSTIQMQDIIKQSAAQVVLCLKEFKDPALLPEDDHARRNDVLAFDIRLCEIALEILHDVQKQMQECTGIFREDWDHLTEILRKVETMRAGYVDSFSSGAEGQTSVAMRFQDVMEQFEQILDGFFKYLNAQKSLVKTCKLIKTRSRQIVAVFTDLAPVVDSLQHVRVLQKIEIAKNDAISSVRNSANDMDTFISRSKDTIETMSGLLTDFLQESDRLLSDFVKEITETVELAERLKASGSEFFVRLKDAWQEIRAALRRFTVFPPGFDEKCGAVRRHLDMLEQTSGDYARLSRQLAAEMEELNAVQQQELEKAGLSAWEMKDDAFKSIIDRFTITLHKKLAGDITGVEVESGIESGEVTFF